MTRTKEILWLGVIGDGHFDGFGPVAGADTGGDAKSLVSID